MQSQAAEDKPAAEATATGKSSGHRGLYAWCIMFVLFHLAWPLRRWVLYKGANDASRVPSEWHGWLHHSYDAIPESHLPPPRIWEKDYVPNLTGTPSAYRPAGALERGGVRAAATGDYEAWTPEA